MDPDNLSDVEAAMPELVGAIRESAEGPRAPFAPPDLGASLYGDAAYEGREEPRTPASPAPAPQPAPAGPTPEEYRAMQARVEQLEGVMRSGYESAQQQRDLYARQQQEASIYSAARQRAEQMAAVPEINPDDVLGDPRKFKAYSDQLVQRAVGATMALLEPAIHENRQLRAEATTNLRRAQEAAVNAAAATIEGFGYGPDEFGPAQRKQVTDRLRALGQDGELMLADPRQIVNAFVLQRAETNQLLPAKAPRTPTVAPANGSRAAAGGARTADQLPAGARDFLRRMRAPVAGNLSHDEQAMLRHAGVF